MCNLHLSYCKLLNKIKFISAWLLGIPHLSLCSVTFCWLLFFIHVVYYLKSIWMYIKFEFWNSVKQTWLGWPTTQFYPGFKDFRNRTFSAKRKSQANQDKLVTLILTQSSIQVKFWLMDVFYSLLSLEMLINNCPEYFK